MSSNWHRLSHKTRIMFREYGMSDNIFAHRSQYGKWSGNLAGNLVMNVMITGTVGMIKNL